MHEVIKKLLTILVAIIFLGFESFIFILRNITIDYKISNTSDIADIVNNKNSKDLSSYVIIDKEPIAFAEYSGGGDNLYYFVEKDDNVYILFANKNTINNIDFDKLPSDYKIYGITTKYINKFKEIILYAYNDRYDENLTNETFDSKLGYVYLNTTLDKYALTPEYNMLIIVFGLMFIVTFVYGFGGIIKYYVKR